MRAIVLLALLMLPEVAWAQWDSYPGAPDPRQQELDRMRQQLDQYQACDYYCQLRRQSDDQAAQQRRAFEFNEMEMERDRSRQFTQPRPNSR